MHQFRLAVATRCFVQPIIESIRSAASLGVAGVQFDLRDELRPAQLTETGRRDLMHQISEHGLKVASAVLPLNHPLYESERIDGRVAAIHDALKSAYSIKAGTLCLRIGQIPEEETSTQRKLLIEVLRDLARYANHLGTALAITPSNDSATTLKTLLDEIKTGPIGIDFDPAHFAMTGRSVTESLRTLHHLVMHVQIRDGVRGIDGGQEEIVGLGNVEWIELMALLGEMDYRGWLTAIRSQGEQKARDMSRGVKFIQRMLLGG